MKSKPTTRKKVIPKSAFKEGNLTSRIGGFAKRGKTHSLQRELALYLFFRVADFNIDGYDLLLKFENPEINMKFCAEHQIDPKSIKVNKKYIEFKIINKNYSGQKRQSEHGSTSNFYTYISEFRDFVNNGITEEELATVLPANQQDAFRNLNKAQRRDFHLVYLGMIIKGIERLEEIGVSPIATNIHTALISLALEEVQRKKKDKLFPLNF